MDGLSKWQMKPGSVKPGNSQLSAVRPQVLEVLKEKGISADGLYSKAVDETDTVGVDAVITLCAEEICPAFPGKVHRLHWALPDPAKAAGGDAAHDDVFVGG